jgi:hypothetical protein
VSTGAFAQPASNVRTVLGRFGGQGHAAVALAAIALAARFGLLRIGALRPSTVGCPSPGWATQCRRPATCTTS